MEDKFDFLNDDVKDISLELEAVSDDDVVDDLSVLKNEKKQTEDTESDFDLDSILGKSDKDADAELDFEDTNNEKFFWENPQKEDELGNNDLSEDINDNVSGQSEVSVPVVGEQDRAENIDVSDEKSNIDFEPEEELNFEQEAVAEAEQNTEENFDLETEKAIKEENSLDVSLSGDETSEIDEAEVNDWQDSSDEVENDNIPYVEEKPQQPYDMVEESNFVHWYSGNSSEPLFEITKDTESSIITGSDECRLIHINVGYDTYGWLVEFDNGVYMSLPDVKIYQLRNGALPSQNGVITYGANRFEFSGIERIVVYESVRYFSYGV